MNKCKFLLSVVIHDDGDKTSEYYPVRNRFVVKLIQDKGVDEAIRFVEGVKDILPRYKQIINSIKRDGGNLLFDCEKTFDGIVNMFTPCGYSSKPYLLDLYTEINNNLEMVVPLSDFYESLELQGDMDE